LLGSSAEHDRVRRSIEGRPELFLERRHWLAGRAEYAPSGSAFGGGGHFVADEVLRKVQAAFEKLDVSLAEAEHCVAAHRCREPMIVIRRATSNQ
jgi:hypothetical protein